MPEGSKLDTFLLHAHVASPPAAQIRFPPRCRLNSVPIAWLGSEEEAVSLLWNAGNLAQWRGGEASAVPTPVAAFCLRFDEPVTLGGPPSPAKLAAGVWLSRKGKP